MEFENSNYQQKKIPLTKFYKSLVVGKTSLRGAPYPPPNIIFQQAN